MYSIKDKKRKKHTISKKGIYLISLFVFLIFIFLNTNTFKSLIKNYNFEGSLWPQLYLSNDAIFGKESSDEISSKMEEYLSSNNINIKAKTFVVYDVTSNKVIYGKDEQIVQPLASLTKIMTSYLAISECDDNAKELLDKLMIASSNEAAEDIASQCPNYDEFIDSMNILAKKNRLNMKFTNPSGLDTIDGVEASNWGDSVSVAKLMNLLYEKDSRFLSHTTMSDFDNITNTNKYVANLPFLAGSKTGFTDVAGGNLATIYNILSGGRIAIVVLGSTKEDRFTDTFNLLKAYLYSI